MHEGKVEETAYPRNPLDVLAQQIVAIVSAGAAGGRGPLRAGPPGRAFRRAAARVLRRRARHALGPLPLGRVRGAEAPHHLGPRRRARPGARGGGPDRHRQRGARSRTAGSTASSSAGDDPRRSLRVGELDEEMVFESQPGDVFVLGASSWRIEEISHDRVTVSPAPGLPGKMPFWHGDRPGRPREFGEAIGELSRASSPRQKPADAVETLRERPRPRPKRGDGTSWPTWASRREATGEVPSDRTIVSSGTATRSATGACACSRRGAPGCTRPGRRRSSRG